MKSLLFVMIAGLASAAMLVSCGGNGSKASASGPFGEIPSLVSDFETFSDAKQAELQSGGEDNMKKILEEMKAAEEKFKESMNAAFEKGKGKEVVTEIDPELPLKVVTPMKIEDISVSRHLVKLVGELELTATAIGFDSYEPTDAFELDDLVVLSYDNNGKPFAYDRLSKDMGGEPMPAGSKVPVDTHIHIESYNAASMGCLSKILITLKGSELYDQAKAAADALKGK